MNHNTQKNFQLLIQQHLTTNKLFCIFYLVFLEWWPCMVHLIQVLVQNTT